MKEIVLNVHNVWKSFGGVHAVAGCTFAVHRGGVTALIGPNGAGKTTLFNLVNGFLPVDRGAITFEGRDVTGWDVWERSRLGMSRTFQSSRTFHNLSIRDNLALAIRQDDDRFFKTFFEREERSFDGAIREMMRFVGLEKDLRGRPAHLSYGEQKLFDLCRALLNPHTFLLFDEPVAGVNPVLRERFKEIVRGLKERGESILLIEHDIDFVRSVADRVIVMDQGAVLREGLPEDVLRDPAVLDAYLGKTDVHAH